MAKNSNNNNNRNHKRKGNKSSNWNKGKVNLKGTNPISTYGDNFMINLAGNISYHYPIGKPLDLSNNELGTYPSYNKTISSAIPGVMVLNYLPNPGISTDTSSPINIAMSKLSAEIRAKGQISYNPYYDNCDLGFYYIAITNLFVAYRWLTRAFSLHHNFKQLNLYTPGALIRSMGIDYDDFSQNEAQIIYYLNDFSRRLNTLLLPKELTFAERQIYMCSNIYKDGEGDKVQYYLFNPKYLYKYDPTSPQLIAVDWRPSTLMTWNTIRTKMEDLINVIINDEGIRRIMADMVKAGFSRWETSPVDWNATIEPIYDQEITYQVHNANFLSFDTVQNINITQVTTSNVEFRLHWNPTFKGVPGGSLFKRLIDQPHAEPSPSDNMLSSRLMYTVNNYKQVTGTPKYDITIKSCGSEIILNAEIIVYTHDITQTGSPEILWAFDYRTVYTIRYGTVPTVTPNIPLVGFEGENYNSGQYFGTELNSIIAGSTFNNRPIQYLSNVPNSTNKPYFCGVLTPLENFTVVEDSEIEKMHRTALNREFGVTQ